MKQASADHLSIAVVGAGRMARSHMRAIVSLRDRASLVAVADHSASALEDISTAYPEVFTASDLGTLLSQTRPDVVHICTPMETHASLAQEAIEAGSHVYIEKPVTLSVEDLNPLLEAAHRKNRLVCGGHQVLFERSYLALRTRLAAIGEPVHVESFFSFRPVRTGSGGSQPLTEAQQLIDVLPHPTYLLLDLLESVAPTASTSLEGLHLSNSGTVHGLLSRGGLRGSLVVSLKARPVEHWLRVTGTNGTIHADFVRGSVQELLGPGSSGIDKAVNPYKLSVQLATRTTGALIRRIRSRGASYPGLVEAFSSFYDAIQVGGSSPTSPDQIRGTVAVLEKVQELLLGAERSKLAEMPPPTPDPRTLVTGGTGLLGREVARLLLESGKGVRILARRLPPATERLLGAEYLVADLAEGIDPKQLQGIETVIHCAAETAGDRSAHARNSIAATESLMRTAAAAGARTFLHVSSVAVLNDGAPGAVRDNTSLHPRPDTLGPYVWGKLESERLARRLGIELDLMVKVLRPVPLMSRAHFAPPGRLGRRIGNLYVAVGSPRNRLVVADAGDTARAMVAVAFDPLAVPDTMNLVPENSPTRGQLVEVLRESYPEVQVIWLPTLLLHPLSWAAVVIQKLLRPGRPAIRLAPAFASRVYQMGPAAQLMNCKPSPTGSGARMEQAHAP